MPVMSGVGCINRRRRTSTSIVILAKEDEEEAVRENWNEDPYTETELELETPIMAAEGPGSLDQRKKQILNNNYSNLTIDVFGENTNYGKPIILSSLSKLDEILKAGNTTVTRTQGVNVDTVTTQDGKYFLRCHLLSLLDFSQSDHIPYKHAFEAAAAIALAAHHLNEGIGWIVPELSGLNERCPIRFTTGFVDSENDQGVSLKHVIESTDRIQDRPCAFIGATLSTVSITTSIVSGIRGYPQISSDSTSEELDDKAQFPLFGRTVPSDLDNAVPIVRFFRQKLNATHLAILHVNNGYGNAFADNLKLAAQVHAPDLVIEKTEVSEHANPQLIVDAVAALKATQFTLVFAALNDHVIDAVMEEAYHQGVAGNGIHNWFFSNTFGDIADRYFERDSPLHRAYRGIGRMQVSGGHTGMPSFDTFACNLRTLRSSPPDLDFLASLLPQKEWNNNYDFPGKARDMSKAPFLYDDDFLTPIPKMADRTSPAYEAAVALGLAACSLVDQGLPFTGRNHFDEFTRTTFRGVEADVKFQNLTGTRDPNTTLFAVENEVESEVEVSSPNGTKTTMIHFRAGISLIYDQGAWEFLEEFIFNDGTTVIPADLIPAPEVNHLYIHTPLKIFGLFLYLIIMALAIRFIWWTEKNKKQRVVRASQPLFLRVICAGVIIFASAIVPMNIDDRVASIQGCSISCNFFYWLFFMGFAIMFSGLFTKIYRVNQILNNPVKFKRVKVTVRDVIKPMAAIIGVNFIVLVVMTAAAPAEYQIVVSQTDQFGRPTETYGHCSTHAQLPYYAVLGIINFGALCFAIQQAYNTRKLATEFSESRYIFYAMIGIIVALFQGIPVLILVRDSPDVQDFIKCTVIFVTCCSVLLFLFVPKMKYLTKMMKKTRSERINASCIVSGLDQSSNHNQGVQDHSGHYRNAQPGSPVNNRNVIPISSLSGLSAASSTSNDSEEGVRFSTKSQEELKMENDALRRRLNIKNVSLGTLATDSSVSNDSGGSSGIKILSRKSATELMEENRRLKKMLKKAKKRTGQREAGLPGEGGEAENEEDEDDASPPKDKPQGRQVSFKLDNEPFGSFSDLPALVMPPISEGGASVDDIDDGGLPTIGEVSVADIEAATMANRGRGPPANHGDNHDLNSDDETAPNSSDNTAINSKNGEEMGRFKSEETSIKTGNIEQFEDEFIYTSETHELERYQKEEEKQEEGLAGDIEQANIIVSLLNAPSS